MRIGLYSITYRGVWHKGEAIDVFNLLPLAKEQGWEGIELDTERPHAAKKDGELADIEYVHDQTRMALEYLKGLRAAGT